MHSQTLNSILVLVAVLCSTGIVSNNAEFQKLETANKLNMLVQHSGWRLLDDVKILKKHRKEIVDPISEITEAISLNRKPVDEINVLERHKDISTVLMCKYGEIVFHYKDLVHHYIRLCQNVKSWSDSFQRYYDCLDLLLNKLHGMSPRFKCMLDALHSIYSLVPQLKPKHNVMIAMEKLAEYTLTLGSTTLTTLFEQGANVYVVDRKINTIGEYFSEVYKKNIHFFTHDHCKVPRKKKWTAASLVDNLLYAKSNQLIPQQTTMLQYIVHEMDSYFDEIVGKWFYDLGFAYGVDGKVTIRTE